MLKNKKMIMVKGASEMVLDTCNYWYDQTKNSINPIN